jgi:uncharacterized protein (TIGR03435 family)
MRLGILNRLRVLSTLVPSSVLLLSTAAAQVTAPKAPAFEVASVKINKSGPAGTKIDFQPKRMSLVNVPLRAIIQLAYGIQQATRLVVPDWVASERYDIVATSEEVMSLEQRRLMMQALLADRFKLVGHTEAKEQSAFGLALARSDGRLGPSLRPFTGVCANAPGARAADSTEPPENAPQAVRCGVRPGIPGKLMLIGIRLSLLASALSLPLGRTVFDRTGLTGLYDVELSFAPEGPDTETPDRTGSSLVSALREQLGLKLNSEKETVEVLIVDRIDRPTEN